VPAADLTVRPGLVIPGAELRETASRSSGPGGQHVNKSATRVTLRWNAARSSALGPVRRARLLTRLARRLTGDGELVVHAGRHRSRARNRELARERLAELVRGAVAAQRPRRATRPTRTSSERRLTGKRHRGSIKRQRRRPGAED
jgi:ribosome-associated protein